MPAKSKAQGRLMQAKAARGEISKKTAAHFRPRKGLPERVRKHKR